jgi:hypothetical protein
LQERIDKVTQRIRDLPNGEAEFGKEIGLLRTVSQVMTEATGILARPETGRRAIAAETEIIELLLQSRRFNPGGGGGGGSNPGTAAHATGETGATLPEEFRTGLDTYFNRLEKTSK